MRSLLGINVAHKRDTSWLLAVHRKGEVMRMLKLFLILLVLSKLAACSSMDKLGKVQAWEKGKLARQEMKFDRDLLDGKFVDHIYFSKEGAAGGASVGGGGCGCN